MPTVNVEENIKQLRSSIEKMTQEVFRLQGMLSTFEGFKKGGLETIDLPNDPNQSVKNPNDQPQTDVNGSELLSTVMANPSLMAAVMSAMTNTTSSGNVPNQPVEELESVQEKPE